MDKHFLVERQGKTFVLYAGLLDQAHGEGLKAIRTQLIQTPSPENGHVAICFAEVTTEKGTFTGLGDASPENVARMMVPHLLRMAETRAKARALRDAVNVGAAALEELAEDEPAAEATPRAEVKVETPSPRANPSPKPAPPTAPSPAARPALASQAQLRAIYAIAKERGLAEGEVDRRAMQSYGHRPSELSVQQASDFITALKGGDL